MKIRVAALKPHWMLVISFFVAGVFLGSLSIYLWLNTEALPLIKIHLQSPGYKYINPLLAVDLEQGDKFSQNKALQLKLNQLFDAYKSAHLITNASIYFRDIEPALWVDINSEKKFSPGQLLKLPIMISYFKLAETDPAILDERLTYYGRGDDTQNQSKNLFPIPLEGKLERGKAYTVRELIRKMVVFANNEAANLLFDAIDKDSLNEVFSDLGIDFREDKTTQDFISLKTYTLFFRILYNATYLNREYSEKALELLVETDNSVGLSTTIPKNIPTANRYGGRSLTNATDGSQFELHDCGITYYPAHPYLLCAMAQGKSLENLEKFLKEIGDAVFKEMEYNYTT